MTDSAKEPSKGAATPGPWKMLHDADGDYAICRDNFSDERLIAITDSDEPEDEANALLISKAPQMAELLGRVADSLDVPPGLRDDARRLLTDLEVKP